MNEAEVTHYITETFADARAFTKDGDTFFFYGPEEKFPFATMVTSDNDFDHVSNLSRPEVFRLNIGVSKETFRSLFGDQPASSYKAIDPNYDFSTLDQLMPHPMYGNMHWVCVLNPSAATFESVQPLLAEAYERAVTKYTKAHPAEQS